MPLGQCLGRQGQSEIGVIAADQRQDTVALQIADAGTVFAWRWFRSSTRAALAVRQRPP